MLFSCACGADSVGDAGSAGEVGSMMLVNAGDMCSAADAGFCEWCLDLQLMFVWGGCIDA